LHPQMASLIDRCRSGETIWKVDQIGLEHENRHISVQLSLSLIGDSEATAKEIVITMQDSSSTDGQDNNAQ